MDETEITTIQKLDRVEARGGAHQADSVTSAEWGNFVTIAFATNALGNVFPPLFVFQRVRYHDHFILERPMGSARALNPSDWMQDELYMHFLEHFKKRTNLSPSRKVSLVLGNHSSHIHINSQILTHLTLMSCTSL